MSENICHKLKVFGIFSVCYNITQLSVTLITQFNITWVALVWWVWMKVGWLRGLKDVWGGIRPGGPCREWKREWVWLFWVKTNNKYLLGTFLHTTQNILPKKFGTGRKYMNCELFLYVTETMICQLKRQGWRWVFGTPKGVRR